MKTVVILTIYAGPLGCFQPGAMPELEDKHAEELVNANCARWPTAEDRRENAMRNPPERAAHVANAENDSRRAQGKIRTAQEGKPGGKGFLGKKPQP